MLIENYIDLGNRRWKENVGSIRSLIQEWKVKTIKLVLTHYQKVVICTLSILKDISSVVFPNLTQINIFGNQIVSIEGVSRIFMPKNVHA